METIAINGGGWANASDFYEAYLAAVGAPKWHGRNLDALWDSLTGGGINQRNPPFRVQISGTSEMGDDARKMVTRFEALISQARGEGCSVEIALLP